MTAAECVEKLTAGGWTHEAVFRCPAGVLADWLRERDDEDTADRLGDGKWVLVSAIRDEAYMRAPYEQVEGIRLYVRQVVGNMPHMEAQATSSLWATAATQNPIHLAADRRQLGRHSLTENQK